MSISVKVTKNMKELLAAGALIEAEVSRRLDDIGDDLARASSGAAPHDSGTLDSSYQVNSSGNSVTISFSATNKGFDYALYMHEGSYQLGEGSLAKPGGIGMSGQHYRVGPKYLDRPLHGEANEYADHIKEGIELILGE